MMIADNIKRLRENAGLSQAALARKLGVTRASVNAWEMELSAPTAQYLIALAQLFHTTTDDILGLEPQEQIVLRDMTEQEKRLVYDLITLSAPGFYQIHSCFPVFEIVNFNTVLFTHS